MFIECRVNCVNRPNVYKWFDHLKRGRKSVGNKPRSGNLVKVSGSLLESRVDELISYNLLF